MCLITRDLVKTHNTGCTIDMTSASDELQVKHFTAAVSPVPQPFIQWSSTVTLSYTLVLSSRYITNKRRGWCKSLLWYDVICHVCRCHPSISQVSSAVRVRPRRPHKHATNHQNPPLYWISRGRLADRPACIINYRRRPVVTSGTVCDSWHRSSETKPGGSGLVPVSLSTIRSLFSRTYTLIAGETDGNRAHVLFWLVVVWVKWSEFSLY